MAAAQPSARACNAAAAAAAALALLFTLCTASAAAGEARQSAFCSLTGGCRNMTGSGRLSQRHVAVLLQQLDLLLNGTVGTDAFGAAYRPLIAGSVRLAFHACAGDGGCGGCINVNDPSNNGLSLTIGALSDFRNRLLRVPQFADCTLTHADLWQAAAIVALTNSPLDVGNASVCSLPVAFGRADCGTAPYTDAIIPYPDRRWTIDQLLPFAAKLGLTAEQFVALMGAHSLGVVRDFDGRVLAQWDRTPDQANGPFYFRTIASQANVWEAVPFNYTSSETPVMYSYSRDSPTNKLIFLTSDFSLAFNITEKDPTATGQPTAPLVGCPFASTRSSVLRFAASTTAWAQVFCGAWSVLTTRGYAPGELRPGAAASG